MTPTIRRLVIAWFALVLVLPGALYAGGVRSELDENRDPTAWPTWGWRGAIEEETWAQVGDWATDRLPLRDRAIDLRRELDDAVDLLPGSHTDAAIGEDGWLFLRKTTLDDCGDAPGPDTFVEMADAFASAAQVAGVEPLFTVVPDKESIYPEHLPVEGLTNLLGLAESEEPDCAAEWRRALEQAAVDRPWLAHLYDPILERTRAGHQTYFRIDTHWTDHGSVPWVAAVVDHYDAGRFREQAIIETGSEELSGDLARMLGETRREVQPTLNVLRPGLPVQATEFGDDTGGLNENVVQVFSVSGTGAVNEGTLLVVGDSFGERSVRMLAPWFRQVVWIHWRLVAAEGVDGVLASLPQGTVTEPIDAVVVQLVQRQLPEDQYPGFLPELTAWLESLPAE